jgi:hypothetical protein
MTDIVPHRHDRRSLMVDREMSSTTMPVVQACSVRVTGAIRRVLTRRAHGQKTPHRDKVRAQIVLLAARRWSNAAIRWLTREAIKPWHYRSWLFPP